MDSSNRAAVVHVSYVFGAICRDRLAQLMLLISISNVKRYNKTNDQKPKTCHTVCIERNTFHSPSFDHTNPWPQHSLCCWLFSSSLAFSFCTSQKNPRPKQRGWWATATNTKPLPNGSTSRISRSPHGAEHDHTHLWAEGSCLRWQFHRLLQVHHGWDLLWSWPGIQRADRLQAQPCFIRPIHCGDPHMRFYITCLAVTLFSVAQYVDHRAAKHCERVTSMTYNQCRQH